ncbi:MAG: putative Ig domain-containing protein [Burkholderiales bacterium]|jgi:predicted outer membrane repeat protein|nr:putative Ig domain-containing protein [Burkholderiales bacterium]
MRFAALLGAVFGKKTARHQKTSLLPCREAKHHEAKQHKARHYKKVGFSALKIGLSAFVAAMLCVGVAAQAATVTVNDVTDGSVAGKCTLRDAVAAVNTAMAVNGCAAGDGSNDTITFDAGVFNTPTTIDVTASGEIAISKSLTIEGLLDVDDAPLITLDGKSANRILNFSGSVLTVSGLAFQNGSVASGASGGAIYAPGASATVIVRNSVFKNNQATSSYGNGGAIYAYGVNATVNVSNSTFENNQAGGVGSGSGGAIGTNGTANVSNSAFKGNHARYGGGAIYAYTTANVSDSTFGNNRSSGSYGGAIHAIGTANVSNSAFENNQANSNGGAISATTANVSNSTFEGNRASNNDGGAIHVWTALKASHLTLLDNSATRGAAIYGASGSVRIDNSLILSSAALVGAPTLCAVVGAGSIGGSYNIEWVNGADTTSCSNTNNVSGGSGVIGAIVETTLADNGGPTPTLALPAGSPAIGAADPSGATSQMLVINFSPTPVTATWGDATLDQRGMPRKTRTVGRDIGAFEKQIGIGGAPANGQVGVFYTDNSIQASDGTPSYRYEVTDGALPPGLSLDLDTGAIIGTPTTADSYTFTVTVTDSSQPTAQTASVEFTIVIAAAPPPPVNGATSIPVLPMPLALLLALGLAVVGIGFRKRKMTKMDIF